MESAVQVWSSGLEEWEDIVLPLGDSLRLRLNHEHDKHVNGVMYAHFTDLLGRWYRSPMPKDDNGSH